MWINPVRQNIVTYYPLIKSTFSKKNSFEGLLFYVMIHLGYVNHKLKFMKKYIICSLATLIFGLLLFSCAKVDTKPVKSNLPLDFRSASNVKICHLIGNGEWIDIEVNMNAVPSHLAHGDVILDFDNDGYYLNNKCGFEPVGDCDDENPEISPGQLEICGDNIDQNCDGIDSDCVLNCADIPCCFCDLIEGVVIDQNIYYCDSTATWLGCDGCIKAEQFALTLFTTEFSITISTYSKYCPEKTSESYCYVYTQLSGGSFTELSEDQAIKCRELLRKIAEEYELDNQCSSGTIDCNG